jgi:hypothetical protein
MLLLLRPPQMEVENYVVNNGYFIPVCHQDYWLGYKAQFWGRWLPLDGNVPSTGNTTYRNFGRFPVQEPNGRRVPELCTVANSTSGAANTTFGWSDTDCDSGRRPYVCRIIRGWRCRYIWWLWSVARATCTAVIVLHHGACPS